MRHKSLVLLATVIVALVAGLALLAACQPQEYDLSFETIERRDSSGTGEYYEDKGPRLVVIAKASEADALGNTVSLDAQAQLRNLDFDRYFVIAVFQGWRPEIPTPQSGAEVYRISRNGNTVTIYTHLYEPVEGHARLPVSNSPYHLVKVRREEDMRGELEFVLSIDGLGVVRQTHSIP